MKKLLSILLSALMIFSCFSISVYAEDVDLVQLFKANNINVVKAEVLGKVGDKELCNGVFEASAEAIRNYIIGDYLLCSSDFSLNLYIKDGNTIKGLYEAYADRDISNSDLDIIYQIMNTEEVQNNIYVTETVKRFDNEAESLVKAHYNSEDSYCFEFRLLEIYHTEEYTVYNNIREIPPGSCYKFINLGGYKFRYDEQDEYGLAVFVIKENTVYTLEEAYESGIIPDLSVLAEALTSKENALVTFSFNMQKIEGVVAVKTTLYEYLVNTRGLTYWEDESHMSFKDFGKVGDFTLCHGTGALHHESACSDVIGKYKVFAYQEYMGNPLGLYLVKDDTVYPFNSNSYEKGLITDEQVEEVVKLIEANKESDLFDFWKIEQVKFEKEEALISAKYPTPFNYTYNLVKLGNIGEFGLFYDNGVLGEPIEYTKVMGNYYFHSGELVMKPSPLYLYLISDDTAYALEDAYDTGVFTDIESVYKMIKNSGRGFHFSVVEFSNAELLLYNRFNVVYTSLEKLGTLENCEIYYNDTPNLLFLTGEETFGNYKFKMHSLQEPYELGLYVVNSGNIYTFAEAYEAGYVTDMNAVYSIIQKNDITYSFTVEKINQPVLRVKKATVKAGEKVRIFTTENADTVKYVSKNPKIATVTQRGFVTGLKKGTAKITITMDGETVTKKIKVTTDPKLAKNGKAVKTIEVKKNRTVTLKLKGKAKAIKNSYTNTKTAKIISKKNTTFIKVRGLRKGTTTLKIKVNGVKVLKLKVIVGAGSSRPK